MRISYPPPYNLTSLGSSRLVSIPTRHLSSSGSMVALDALPLQVSYLSSVPARSLTTAPTSRTTLTPGTLMPTSSSSTSPLTSVSPTLTTVPPSIPVLSPARTSTLSSSSSSAASTSMPPPHSTSLPKAMAVPTRRTLHLSSMLRTNSWRVRKHRTKPRRVSSISTSLPSCSVTGSRTHTSRWRACPTGPATDRTPSLTTRAAQSARRYAPRSRRASGFYKVVITLSHV